MSNSDDGVRPAGETPGPVALRPMNAGDVVDGMFKLFAANWRAMVLATAVLSVPLQLIALFVQRDLLAGPGFFELLRDPGAGGAVFSGGAPDLGRLFAGTAVVSLLGLLVVQPLVSGSLCAIAVSSSLGRVVAWGDGLRTALRHWWALVIAHVLAVLAYLVPFAVATLVIVAGAATEAVALLVVGVVLLLAAALVALLLMALFVATAPALVTERLGPVAALRRSVRLLRPRMWGVLGIALLAGLVATLVGSALSFPFTAVGQALGGPVGAVLLGVGAIVAALIQAPLTAIPASLLYLDGRVRREGLDLELAADGAAGSHGEGWPPETEGFAGR